VINKRKVTTSDGSLITIIDKIESGEHYGQGEGGKEMG
jgi:hypothetical protein